MTTWTAQAHLLADPLPELGMTAAALNASAWSAGIMPEATRGIAGAAMALTEGRAGKALWARTEPCPDDDVFLSAAAELEAAAAEALKRVTGMGEECQAAHDAAVADYQIAQADANSESPGVKAAGVERMEQARRVIADTQAALEVLGDAAARLAHARLCLARVPGEYAEAYEVPLSAVRRGVKLPHSGAYLNEGSAA